MQTGNKKVAVIIWISDKADFNTRSIKPEIKMGILYVNEKDVTVINVYITNDSFNIHEGKADRTKSRNTNIILCHRVSKGKNKEFEFWTTLWFKLR